MADFDIERQASTANKANGLGPKQSPPEAQSRRRRKRTLMRQSAPPMIAHAVESGVRFKAINTLLPTSLSRVAGTAADVQTIDINAALRMTLVHGRVD